MVSTRASCSFFLLRDRSACCRRFSAMSWRANSTSCAMREKTYPTELLESAVEPDEGSPHQMLSPAVTLLRSAVSFLF